VNKTYPTDLTVSQWDYIKELIPKAKPGGRPRSLDMRQVINGILYVAKGGIQWRMLPKEYPKWKSVYHYFRTRRDDGTWKRIHDTLRAYIRRRAGRHKHPTAGSLDSLAGEGNYDAIHPEELAAASSSQSPGNILFTVIIPPVAGG